MIGGFQALLDLVRVLPVPNARPAFSRDDEAAGLTLLDLGLRMDHVQRVTETLSLIDRTHLRRAMALDVDLRTLTARQREALAVRPLGPLEVPGPGALAGSAPGSGLLWVPVGWQSREHVAPVVIHDQEGAVVPRLTGEATWAVLAAGLTRLLRSQIATRQLALDPGEAAVVPGLQSRWLLERAIVVLVERGVSTAWSRMADLAGGDDLPDHGAEHGRDDDGAHLHAVRAEALAYLRSLDAAPLAEFSHLLDLTAREQLLVALVPVTCTHPHLRFEAAPVPVLPAARPGLAGLRPRDVLPVNREYTVEYSTQVPRRVGAYHLALEVPAEIRVRRFLLSTDADEIALEHLSRDLDRLVDVLGTGTGTGATEDAGWSAVAEADLQDALARVASVSRLRFADLQAYREYVRRFRARFGWELAPAQRSRRTAEQVVATLVAGRCDLSVLAALAVHQERGNLVPLLRAAAPRDQAAALATLRDHLCADELGRGVTVDNDPRDNAAHATWRHVNLRFGPRPMEPVTASFHLALADEPPALVESVVRMLLGLLAVLGVLWWLLDGRPTDGLQSDALVAVLLLVPSILLSRLDIPKGRSILGELRMFPRRIAYLSVILTSGVALVAASDAADFVPAIRAAVAALLVLLGVSLLELAARLVRRRAKVPRSAVVPRWLAHAMGVRRPDRPPLPPDARFLSVGTPAARAARSAGWLEAELDRPADPSGRGSPGPAPRPAELVGTAAETAAAGNTAVAFHVVHAPGVGSTHAAGGGHSLVDDCPEAGELVGFTAFGSTFEVRTRQTCDPVAIRPGDRGPGFLVANARRRTGTRSEADGLVVLHPGAHGPQAPVAEFLVVLGETQDTSYAQALMTTHVAAELMRRVAEVGGLPVFLHAPAAPRPQMRTATERARPAVLPVIRLALADAEPFAAARVAFAEQAVALARAYGLGLSLSEGRASPSVNHWREVVGFDRARYHRARRARFGAHGDGGPGEATMVTVVGPAGARITRDLAALAAGFESLGLGCLALSAWPLQRTVFVNALLACRPSAGRARPGDEPGAADHVVGGTDVVPLARVVRECSLRPDGPAGPGLAAGPLEPALPQRFSVVLASRTAVPSSAEPGGNRVVPFWVGWDVPAPADVDVLTFRLTSAFADEGRPCAVTFLRARRTASDRLRGRAKVAVGVPGAWGTAEFGMLAQRVAARARAAVGEDFPGRSGSVTMQVAWGERWLGSPP